jgi:hypothetical protein
MRADLKGAVRLYNYGQWRAQTGQGLKLLGGESLVRGIAFSKSRKVAKGDRIHPHLPKAGRCGAPPTLGQTWATSVVSFIAQLFGRRCHSAG